MPSLNMYGPYPFTSRELDQEVNTNSPGNYALGYTNDEGRFVPKYVGRSDKDLKQELKAKLGGPYKEFKFSYASSPKEAFEKECRNFHDFGGVKGYLDNEIHPDRPDGTNWQCPLCKRFQSNLNGMRRRVGISQDPKAQKRIGILRNNLNGQVTRKQYSVGGRG